MTRRLGIILATTLVALLVMTDGAWACRCMNRLINRCGYRRAGCCVLLQTNCCQAIAMPGCCQPAAGAMKAAEGAANTAPNANKPAGGSGVEVVSPSNNKPDTKPTEPTKPAEPAKPAEKPAEPKPLELQPAQKATAPEVPAEKRVEKPADPGKIPDLPKPAEKAPEVAKPDVPAPLPASPIPAKPDVATPDTPVPVVPTPVVPKPDAATPDAATPDAAPKPEPAKPDAKPPAKGDDPFGGRDVKPLRMWTDASGQYHVEARFVSFQDGTVRLQKANGGYVRIAYDQLCDGDQSFVLRQGRSLFAQE